MAGHSKWANIKRKKEKEDAWRGKAFTKVARQITIAAREGGGDINANFRLRMAVEAARAINMPNENIQRAINRGTGDVDSVSYEELVYEGYGPGGVALYMQVATDNRNRTAGDLRWILSKHGGNLGESGCVAWMFEKKGSIIISGDNLPTEDELMLAALEAGAEDVITSDEGYEIVCAPENFQAVQENLRQSAIPLTTAELVMEPKTTVTLGEEEARHVLALIEALEEHDDIQTVFSNLELTPEVEAALSE
ncbi:MAG TPA: YebC/PmpR family DNA-binding transcriptional regulator [Firmicutes bacterium]|nr:YebC/PmpR family DNA-binding transcriptional regulator [Bacillota bacterium]